MGQLGAHQHLVENSPVPGLLQADPRADHGQHFRLLWVLLIGGLVNPAGSDFIGCLPGAHGPSSTLLDPLALSYVVVNLRGRGPLPRLSCDELLDEGAIGCAGGNLLLNSDGLLLCWVIFVQLALQIQL